MATSGVIGGSTDHAYIAVEVRWWLNWRDPASNTSSVHAELWARRTNVGWQTYGTFNGGINIDGQDFGISRSLTLGPTDGWVRVHTADKDVVHDAAGNRGVGVSAHGGIPGAGWNSTSCGTTVWLDPLHIQPPAVTAITTTWVTDSRIDLGLAFAPESPRGLAISTQIDRRRVSAPPTDWQRILDAPGKVTSFTDNGVTADAAYEYRATTWNHQGSPPMLVGGVVHTSPAAPTNVVATKAADLSITVTWANAASYLPAQYRIYDNQLLVATVDGSVRSWRHATPDSGISHTYTVQAVHGPRLSPLSAPSPTVVVLAPPNAPTGLAPDGGVVVVGDVVLSWRHNPVDTTPQAFFNLRHRPAGAATWSTLSGTTAEAHTVPLAIGAHEWQVQTKGSADAFGPWSAVATVEVVDAPTVTITAPSDPLGASRLTTTWEWAQAQGIAQSAWRAEIRNAEGLLLEVLSGTGSTSTATFSTRLMDATTYQVHVVASAGNLSATASKTFTTAFPAPAVPSLAASWMELDGLVSVSVAGAAGTVATEHIELERSIDGGHTWEPVIENGPVAFALSDTESLSHGSTLYRATAWSDLPSSASTTVEVVADSDAVWLSAGPTFAATARLPYDPDPQVTAGRNRAAMTYEGRPLPVAYSGEHTTLAQTWSGVWLEPDLVPDDPGMPLTRMIEIAQDSHPVHLLRDPDGRRIYGVLDDVRITRPYPGARGYQLTLTQTERQ